MKKANVLNDKRIRDSIAQYSSLAVTLLYSFCRLFVIALNP